MGAVSIRALAQAAVDALKDAGASQKLLNVYACTGFGELRRRFEARGVTEYSAELADVVVREVRAEFERGAVSSWKCTAVRRGAALLDVFHRTGTLDLPPLSQLCRHRHSCDYADDVTMPTPASNPLCGGCRRAERSA